MRTEVFSPGPNTGRGREVVSSPSAESLLKKCVHFIPLIYNFFILYLISAAVFSYFYTLTHRGHYDGQQFKSRFSCTYVGFVVIVANHPAKWKAVHHSTHCPLLARGCWCRFFLSQSQTQFYFMALHHFCRSVRGEKKCNSIVRSKFNTLALF